MKLRSPKALSRRFPQSGVTLIETLLVVAISSMIMVPLLGWSVMAIQEQVNVRERNTDSASVGLLRTYFISDVASADGAATGAAAAGSDCTGGDGEAQSGSETVLKLEMSPTSHIVYNQTTDSEGTGTSIWRRECNGATVVGTAEMVNRIDSGGTTVTCSPRAAASDPSDCGRINMKITTLDGEAVSMTATVRTGDAVSSPAGPVYVSPNVVTVVSYPDPDRDYVFRGESLTFDASGSTDPTGGTLTHLWDFGDGTTSTDAVATHAYTDLGEHTAIYTATNEDETPASDYVRVEVRNRRPTAVISAPADGFTTNRCENVSFAAAGSNDSGDSSYGGSVDSYAWDYGDGTNSTQGSAAAHTHQFAELSPDDGDEPLTVSLVVTDNDGGDSDEATSAVTVANRPPATPTIEGNGQTTDIVSNGTISVAFTSDASDPDICPTSDEALSYEWDFGDGSPVDTTASPTHTFTSGGSYDVTLEITDGAGETRTSDSFSVSINGLPTASFTRSPAQYRVGKALPANWIQNNSTDPEGESLDADWTFQNGTPANSGSWVPGSVTFGHNVGSADTFVEATYTIGLTVTDPHGGQASTTRPIKIVGAPAPTGLDKTGQRRVCVASLPFVGCVDYEYYNTFSWNASAAPISRYQLQIRYDDCGWGTCWETTEHVTTGTSIEIKEHPAGGDDVYIRVRAEDDTIDKWGAWTTPEKEVELYG